MARPLRRILSIAGDAQAPPALLRLPPAAAAMILPMHALSGMLQHIGKYDFSIDLV
jgi:hypothetical protein